MLLELPAAAAAAGLIATIVANRLAERRIRRLVARQEENLAHAVHELRTPLTSVLTVFDLLRNGLATSDAERVEFLDEGEVAARHLAFLVDDMLDGAALAAGRLSLVVVEQPLCDVTQNAVRLLSTVARHREVTIAANVPAELRVRADARRLLQVMFNLVGNALKFSPPGGRVTVDAAVAGDVVRLRVGDEGPGVPAALQRRLFTPFGRDDRDGPAGTGLGLFVTKALLERMGGSIGYSTRSPHGAEFWFDLPRGRSCTIAPPLAVAR